MSVNYKTDLQSNNIDLKAILDAVNALPEAGSGEVINPVIQPLTVTENGTYTVSDGVDGYNPVTVDVPIPDGYIQPIGTLNITENGEYDVTEKAGVVVSVDAPEPTLQEKTVTPTTVQQSVTPDNGYDGLSKVTVDGDLNLVPENIVSGKSIFGVVGSAESGGGGSGSIKTCSVTVWGYGLEVISVYAAAIDSGAITTAHADGRATGVLGGEYSPAVLDNVLCGAPITVITYDFNTWDWPVSIDGDAVLSVAESCHHVFVANGDCVITIGEE